MDQIRDIAPAHERPLFPMAVNSPKSDMPINEPEEERGASLEERLANWGSD